VHWGLLGKRSAFPLNRKFKEKKMATKHLILKGTVEFCKPWPAQLDTAFAEEGDARGGNWNCDFIPDEDSTKAYNALGAKAKIRDGKLKLRRYERHPVLGELGPVLVSRVDPGTAIGNGSTVTVGIDAYDYEYKGRASKGIRWVSLEVEKLVEYEKPATSKPAVGVPVV
jgi:hypothetical protein